RPPGVSRRGGAPRALLEPPRLPAGGGHPGAALGRHRPPGLPLDGGGGHGRLAEGWRVGSRRPASTGRRGGRDGRGGREGPGRAGGGSALAPPERNGLPAPRRPRGDSLEGDGRWTV